MQKVALSVKEQISKMEPVLKKLREQYVRLVGSNSKPRKGAPDVSAIQKDLDGAWQKYALFNFF
jgi:hypothetical protein